MVRLIITLILIVGSISYADDAVFIQQNQAAPFAGFLLPKEKVQELYNQSIDASTNKALNDSLTKSLDLEKQNNDLLNKKINLLLDQNDKLAESLHSEISLNTLEKIAYFAGGIIVVGLAISGVHNLYH